VVAVSFAESEVHAFLYPERFAHGRIQTPHPGVFDDVLTEIAAGSRLRVLKESSPTLRVLSAENFAVINSLEGRMSLEIRAGEGAIGSVGQWVIGWFDR
jgi:hypothetical protein